MRRPLLCVVDVWNLLWIVPPRTPEEVSSQGKKKKKLKPTTSDHLFSMTILNLTHCDCRMRRVITAWFTVACIGVLCVKNTGRWEIISLMQMLLLQLLWILLQFKQWTPKGTKTLRLLLHHHRLHHPPKANTMISRWSLFRKHSCCCVCSLTFLCREVFVPADYVGFTDASFILRPSSLVFFFYILLNLTFEIIECLWIWK